MYPVACRRYRANNLPASEPNTSGDWKANSPIEPFMGGAKRLAVINLQHRRTSRTLPACLSCSGTPAARASVCNVCQLRLVSPLISPIVVPYVIPYITPFKEFRLQYITRVKGLCATLLTELWCLKVRGAGKRGAAALVLAARTLGAFATPPGAAAQGRWPTSN